MATAGCLERYLSLQTTWEDCGLNQLTALPEDLLQVPAADFDRWVTSILPAARQAINILKCVFDPEVVIIGGLMPAAAAGKDRYAVISPCCARCAVDIAMLTGCVSG